MIEAVLRSVHIDAQYIFVLRDEHIETTDIVGVVTSVVPDCKIISLAGPTEGAACSVMAARDLIDNDQPLLIVNCDNILHWDSEKRYAEWIESGADGLIGYFRSYDPKFSYISINEDGFVDQVVEKKVISSYATSGIYGWRRGSDFVQGVEDMIRIGARTNGEYYVAPVFDICLHSHARFNIRPFACGMTSLGTPEDLLRYQTGV